MKSSAMAELQPKTVELTGFRNSLSWSVHGELEA